MRYVLLAVVASLAAIPLSVQSVAAQDWGGVTVHRGTHGGHHGGFHRRDRKFDDFRDSRRDRRHRGDDVVADGWGWYGYSDINRSWDHDSFNDWWHERPWRSYPRWMTSSSCDRLWWGGGSWRCAW